MRLTAENPDSLCTAFRIESGVIAFVGGGGKTTAMLRIAHALCARGRVLVTTSTHIYPPQGMPVLLDPSALRVAQALGRMHPVCVGIQEASGKLTAPAIPFETLAEMADYVLVEADGAKGKPLKAPAAHEPVLPINCSHVIAVAGLDGIGRPIREAAFRPELYAGILGCDPSQPVTPADAAKVLCSELGQYKDIREPMRFSVLLNKADDAGRLETAREVAEALDGARVERAVAAGCKEMRIC